MFGVGWGICWLVDKLNFINGFGISKQLKMLSVFLYTT